MEGAGPFRVACGVLGGDAERGQRCRGASSGQSGATARKQPVIALDMQPVPVTAASNSCPLATASTRSPSET